MNSSELESIWQKQHAFEPSPENIAQLANALHSADRKFQRIIWWRDVREAGAALICAAVFGFVGQTWLRWVAVTGCLFVTAYIVVSRMAVRYRAEGLSLVERLHQMLHQTQMQIRLVRSVLWWYLLPCAIATIAFVLDRASGQGRLPKKFDPFYLAAFVGVMSVFYVAAYWLNQRAVRKSLEPRRARLQEILTDLQQPA
jgi:hypothetical protein